MRHQILHIHIYSVATRPGEPHNALHSSSIYIWYMMCLHLWGALCGLWVHYFCLCSLAILYVSCTSSLPAAVCYWPRGRVHSTYRNTHTHMHAHARTYTHTHIQSVQHVDSQIRIVHKKIRLNSDLLAWEHERFSLKKLSAGTRSSLHGYKDRSRNSMFVPRSAAGRERQCEASPLWSPLKRLSAMVTCCCPASLCVGLTSVSGRSSEM